MMDPRVPRAQRDENKNSKKKNNSRHVKNPLHKKNLLTLLKTFAYTIKKNLGISIPETHKSVFEKNN